MAKSKFSSRRPSIANDSRQQYQSNPFSPFRTPEPAIKIACGEAEATITITPKARKVHHHSYLFKVVGVHGGVIANGEATAKSAIELCTYLRKHYPLNQMISVHSLN